ncbi:hypothetical protein JCM15519_24750 [Fundidesulfovibrio butyratiphilus]
MPQATPEAQARFEACLITLRQLKEASSRREVVERDILLSLLSANKERISEFPASEADQQNLVNTLTTRCETQPGYAHLREWLVEFVAQLNQYEVAKRTGAEDQIPDLESALLVGETLLAKCLQGYIFVIGIIRDELGDTVLHRFGEGALARIDELANAGEADARYWRGFFETFLFEFVAKAYDEVLAGEQYRLVREGAFLALRISLDALTARLPGVGDKTIDKTRLQTAFEHVQTVFEARQAAVFAAGLVSGLPKSLLHEKYAKTDAEFLGRVAAMDQVTAKAGAAALGHLPDVGEDEDPATVKAFLKNQVLALCVGGALALGISREDMGRALKSFSPRDLDAVFTTAGAFHPVAMRHAYQLMIELALLGFMTEKAGDDAGSKVQVRLFKHRRASRKTVEALASEGLNRIRQKVYFEDDPTSPNWLLFKAKTIQDLAEALRLSNMEPKLVTAVQRLWSARQFRSEVVALVNLPLVAKFTPNLQAKLAEILARFGVVKPGAQ